MTKEIVFENPPEGHTGLLVYDDQTDKWYAVLGDSDGHIILEVSSITLPDGLATSEKQLANDHDVNVTNMISGFATSLKQLANDHDVNVTNMISGFATSLKQLANDHDVNVTNMISGFATSEKQLADGHGVVLGGDGLQLRRGDHVVAECELTPGVTTFASLIDVSGAGVLEWLDFASDYTDTQLEVRLDGDFLFNVDVSNVSTVNYLAPIRLQYGQFVGSLWELIDYDAGNSRYGMALKRPVWFNTSLRIRYRTLNTSAKVAIALGYHLF